MGRPSRVRVTGPLEPYASGFREELARQGYRPHAASNQLQLMAHAGRWLASRELGAGELTPARVGAFLEARRAEGYTLWLSPKAMAPVLAYLRGLDVVPTPSPGGPATPVEVGVDSSLTYLAQQRPPAAASNTGSPHFTARVRDSGAAGGA